MGKKALFITMIVGGIVSLPVSALAKGAESATLDGAGLSSPIEFTDLEELELLAAETGIWPATFRQIPNPMEAEKPKGRLGPRYLLSYEFRIPGEPAFQVHQYVYPYARPYPVTFTPPGQKIMDGARSVGGWYVRASDSLRHHLIDKGLPHEAPGAANSTAATGAATSRTWMPFAFVVIGALLLASWIALLWRRRPTPA